MAQDTNSGVLVCRLARDPELRSLASGLSVCDLRVAFTTKRKNNQTGEWEDKSNYANVTVWGRQGEAAARNLAKGSRIGVTYRLEHREWTDQQGNRREALQLVADNVQYLDPPRDRDGGNGGGFTPRQHATPPATPAGGFMDDDDIPF